MPAITINFANDPVKQKHMYYEVPPKPKAVGILAS